MPDGLQQQIAEKFWFNLLTSNVLSSYLSPTALKLLIWWNSNKRFIRQTSTSA